MSLLTPPQIKQKQFIAENQLRTPEDVQEALKALFADTLQAMLDSEQTTNSRKTVTSQYGDVEIAVPRDREGTFTPIVVPKHQTTMVGIEDQIIALYARGMTTRDIQTHLTDLYGARVSPTLVSHVTDKLYYSAQERIVDGAQALHGVAQGRITHADQVRHNVPIAFVNLIPAASHRKAPAA